MWGPVWGKGGAACGAPPSGAPASGLASGSASSTVARSWDASLHSASDSSPGRWESASNHSSSVARGRGRQGAGGGQVCCESQGAAAAQALRRGCAGPRRRRARTRVRALRPGQRAALAGVKRNLLAERASRPQLERRHVCGRRRRGATVSGGGGGWGAQRPRPARARGSRRICEPHPPQRCPRPAGAHPAAAASRARGMCTPAVSPAAPAS
jgi:hypothetical protein